MKIGIIGAGHIGATAARLFSAAGHEVALSNSRGPESLGDTVAKIGPNVRALAVDDAARFGEVVLLAIPWRTPEGLPKPETVAGKIVVDAMNPYREDFSVMDLGSTTSSEETRKRLPGSRLVKAFNTIYFEHLGSQGNVETPFAERRAIFVAGDDADAKQAVMRLIEEIGFAPIDTGGLVEGGRKQQPGSPIYNRDLTGKEAQELIDADLKPRE